MSSMRGSASGIRGSIINNILKDRIFELGVDLGCACGNDAIRNHCKVIIGVDHNLSYMSVAKEFSGYDITVQSDIRYYDVPRNVDAVFMIDSIEHLTKDDGIKLINRISYVPFILITTPSVFFPIVCFDHHYSLWSIEEFKELGLQVLTYNYVLYKVIVAVKGE